MLKGRFTMAKGNRGGKRAGANIDISTKLNNLTSVEEIMDVLESGKYNYYGFRNATDHDIKLINKGQEYLDPSFDWTDNVRSKNKLDGTSAIEITEYMSDADIQKKYKQTLNGYTGNTILLIGDKHGTYGEDDGEIILGSNGYGADVIALIKL